MVEPVEAFYRCGICDKKAGAGVAACPKCKMFVHFKCTESSYKAVLALGDAFVCRKCSAAGSIMQTVQSSALSSQNDQTADSSVLHQTENCEPQTSTPNITQEDCVLDNAIAPAESTPLLRTSSLKTSSSSVKPHGVSSLDESPITFESVVRSSPRKRQNASVEGTPPAKRTQQSESEETPTAELSESLNAITDMQSETSISSGNIQDKQPTEQDSNSRWKLRVNGITVMTAHFISDSPEEVVHGHALKKGFAKYEIKSCYLRQLAKWKDYNNDIHLPGAFVAWRKNQTRQMTGKLLTAETPTKLKENADGEKKMLAPCSCRLKCRDKIQEGQRKEVHDKYWSLSYNEKRTWIIKNAFEVPPKGKNTGSGKRKNSRLYMLKDISVCKTMFMSTLGYTADKFLTVAFKSNVAESTKGKHDHSYHTITSDQEKKMEEHINLFEPGISHYRREHAPHRKYVDPSLTINDMYDCYQKSCEQASESALSKSSYTRKLKNMNISFAKLGHEECETCIQYKEHVCPADDITFEECKCCEKKSKMCECCKRHGLNNRKNRLERKSTLNCSIQRNSNICKCCKLHAIITKRKKKEESKCSTCTGHVAHSEKDRKARAAYHSDREFSESGEKEETYFCSLDLQKVRMLPEIAGLKSAAFTGRITAYNESFSPIGRKKGDSIAILWHQGVAGRNDEDITSAFRKFIYFLQQLKNGKIKHLEMWMDNCCAQNKNWTLFSALVAIVNASWNTLLTITLKYFESGHTFMSADSFHHQVEREALKMKNLYDFADFVQCISKVGKAVEMEAVDFQQWKKQLSESKVSKETRPLLEDVSVLKFCSGSTEMLYKNLHTDENYKSADFLMKKYTEDVKKGAVNPPSVTEYSGVTADRKKGIIRNLLPSIPTTHHSFWNNL